MNKFNFKEKRKKLEVARKNLKSYFVGIDDIIDQVIDRITAWYLFPEIAIRPLIINLWGLTGVGKTDLIRKLSKEIDFSDRYVEIQMSNKSKDTWQKTILSKLLNSSIEPKNPGILLLDEIQRFRTINELGQEIEDNDYQDIWMLLSDGKFSVNSGMKMDMLEMLFDVIYYNDNEEDDSPKENKKKKKKYNIPFYRASKVKRLLNLDNDVQEIMKWSQETLFNEVDAALARPESYMETDYSKLLIFISGNLDEAFRNAVNVSDADNDADEVYKKTSKINMITVKNALKLRFKPEQISRFGNIHIIYPSLNKESFKKIIEKRLEEIQKSFKEYSGINTSFSKNIVNSIYDNGVFPVQGVRPVLSTIDDFINRFAPNAIIHSLEKNNSSIDFSLKENMVIANLIDKEITIGYDYEGILDKIRNKRKKQTNRIVNVAVHEAGHAIIYSLLFGVAPNQLIVNTTSESNLGTVLAHDIYYNKHVFLNYISMVLGGICAEELVFGVDNLSFGGKSDILTATEIISEAIRSCGMYGEEGFNSRTINNHYNEEAYRCNTGMEKSNEKIEDVLKTQRKAAKTILENNIPLLNELSNILINNLRISTNEYVSLLNKYGIACSILDSEIEICYNYKETFEKWCQKE